MRHRWVGESATEGTCRYHRGSELPSRRGSFEHGATEPYRAVFERTLKEEREKASKEEESWVGVESLELPRRGGPRFLPPVLAIAACHSSPLSLSLSFSLFHPFHSIFLSPTQTRRTPLIFIGLASRFHDRDIPFTF